MKEGGLLYSYHIPGIRVAAFVAGFARRRSPARMETLIDIWLF